MNISVIIPIYNVEKFVERCILSIINQTYTKEVECIIVNDCTPDSSMKIVERLVADYKGQIRFKLLNHERNKGIAAVRNTGLNAASGDYIIYSDK
ncbi:MAG: glycosyltransferase family 2 protein [Bacteroides stercoris]